MQRYTTDRFSRLVQHPARKWSGSILTTPEPARGQSTLMDYQVKSNPLINKQQWTEIQSCIAVENI